MRNLQKILALVLALVMSLSLMATAGATDFSDDAEIDETFRESVDVLNGLKVFQGYDNGAYFSPKGDITRAEVAAIIYRIATGDVTDSQVKIYADYNKFSDVPSDHWAAGYINYCTNAEYIKGRGDGKFYPSDKVTGYEALAMILRVVGYDKNGEFTGADWQVQTAATANQRKVTKNVNAGTLGTPASRETVAELLCQAILIEKVNYTLAFGYQISTDPEDTIAYETFKMEKLEGVVTGNEIADLKTDKGTALGANQTRLVIDGREEVMNIPTGLDDIGECVRVYIRPENGTTRSNLVTSKVYSDGLNKVFTTSERVGSVGNTTASSEGITSIEGAEHFINFDQAHKWEARSVIRYTIDVRMSQYDAMVMYWQNGTSGNSRLTGMANTVYAAQNDSGVNNNEYIGRKDIIENWDKLIRTASGATYTYTKTIDAFTNLTDQDYANIRAIFTNADYTNNTIVKGEVYVGTSSITHTDDVSDDIRWEDFVATYLKSEDNKDQIDRNGQGYLLKIIDNDMDGIAEYVLQTRYTVAKVAANGTGLDIAALRFTDDDTCNEVSASDKITVVSGTNLEASEDTVAAGDVVIYAKIDGTVRAQKAESETSRVTTINRTTTPVTATIESGEKKQSAVHEHSEGLASGLTGMVIGTNYTVYYDLFGNIAAYHEGDVGQFVLITNGWFNQTAAAREYAVQAYIDGKLQTVDITNNGQLFIDTTNVNNNTWDRLKKTFGNANGDINHDGGDYLNTIVATLEGSNLVPVDKSYLVNRSVRMFALPDNKDGIPTRDNGVKGQSYETIYSLDATAYKDSKGEATIYGRSDTVYYYVWKDGTINTVTGMPNMVVQTYTGFANIPSINSLYIEDVYAVGSLTHSNTGSITPNPVYTADVVVVELNKDYKYTNTNREQVFIPGAAVVNNSTARVAGYGIETVPMIRGNGEYQDNVQVNLTYSKGYNSVDGRGYIAGGLYFLDPMDNDPSVYTITKMTHADIRANNYLTGYVGLSTVLENNWVTVDTQMETNWTGTGYGYTDVNYVPQNSSLGTVGKTVNTENLYTLSFRTLTKAPATEVFNQWPDIHKSNTNIDPLNELCDWTNKTINTNLSNRNEVLVRYSGGNVVWAVSFAEFDGNDMNPAQTVWYQNLVARNDHVTSGIKFFGVTNNENGDQTSPDPVDADGKPIYTIKVPYAVADGNLIDFPATFAATIRDWSLFKYGVNEYDQRVEKDAKKTEFTDGAKFKLTVSFVSGGSETYYLVLDAASEVAGILSAHTDYLDTDKTPNVLKLPKDAMAISDYIRQFTVNPATSDVTWSFTPRGGASFEVVSEIDRTTGRITGTNSNIPHNYTTSEIASATVTVTSENGSVLYRLSTSGSAATYASFSLGQNVKMEYNGDTYTNDGKTYDIPVGAKVTLSTVNGDYGYFYHGGTAPSTTGGNGFIAETTADKKTAEVTITVSNMGSRVHFVSKAPVINDVTPETGIQSGQINTLTAPVSLKATQNIGADTTINLNGNTLTIAPETATGYGLKVESGKTLTIEGGVLDVKNVTTAAINAADTGKIILKNVELKSDSRGIFVNGNTTGVTVEITGGSITSANVGLQTLGNDTNKATVKLTDVNITSTGDDGIYMPAANDSLTITGGTVTGALNGIEVCGGTLNLNGVTVVNTHSVVGPQTRPATGGSGATGAALAVDPYNTHKVSVTATNCTFTSEGVPVYVCVATGYSGSEHTVSLNNCVNGKTNASITGVAGQADVRLTDGLTSDKMTVYVNNQQIVPAPASPEVIR